MIKRILLTAVCLMAVSTIEVMAQGYTALWKQVSEAQSKDLPKTEIEVLQQIVAKAESESSYGQLLKAKLRQAAVQTQISPDSADVELERVKADLAKAEEKGNRVLAAVYQSVLGRIYKDKGSSRYRYTGADPDQELYKQLSKDYYAKSMEPVELLAKQSSKGYEPTFIEGSDSHIFGGDLLHALGIEAGDWKTLHQWYDSHGNRQAACLSALYLLKDTYANEQKDADNLTAYSMRKSKYLQTLDSLINDYQDLKECGELAIERYHFMDESEDASAEEKMNYINYALQHWGAWPRMNILRNAQNQLTLPSFSVHIGDEIQRPDTPRKVEVRQLVNCQRLTMTVTRVDVKGDTDLDPNRDEDYNKLRKLLVNDDTKQTVTRRYVGQPDYKVLQDSMTIEGLPIGVYLVEFTTDKNISPERMLLYVSDLYVIREPLPDNRMRLVVVNATTGRPVQGAKIHLTSSYYYKKLSPVTLTTDNKGEAMYQYEDDMLNQMYVSTNKDKAFPQQWMGGRYSFYDNRTTNTKYNLLTDRSIYRPGQTVHVTVIAYKIEQHEFSSVLPDKDLNLQLRNANNEVVSEKRVTTDAYGKASADFALPLSGLTGQYSINTLGNTTYFSVEEYKRPTFQVDFDEVTEQYEDGDTVTVVGHARSFAGVPVQGARVKCKVTRRQASWWWWRQSGEGDKTILTDTLVTDDEGRFEVRVPMHLPVKALQDNNYWSPRYYSFVIAADATDAAGETHHGETSLPLSNRKTAFSVSIPSKIEAESPAKVSFSYNNNAGNPIPGKVTYWIKDEGQKTKETKTVAANESFEMMFNHLKSGRYILEATCGEDSLQQEFVVFSLKDKRPAIETHDWFHYTGTTFPADGSPILVQMGSTDKDQHVVYTLVTGETVLENGSFDQSNAITTRQFTWKEEYGDGVTFTCAWVREGILYKHSLRMYRPLPNKSLKLSWKTFRDRLTPGQKEEWTLHVDWPDKDSSKYEYASEITERTASLVAVLFDKSLDDIREHYWPFSLSIYRNTPSTNWDGLEKKDRSLQGEQPYRLLGEYPLRFTHFDDEIFDFSPRVSIMYESRGGRPIRLRGAKAKSGAVLEEVVPMLEKAVVSDAVEDRAVTTNSSNNDSADEGGDSGKTSDQVRENLNETAFFYPSLLTDENGDIQISFTLPESITTWRFMGLATDKDVRYGRIEGEVVAKKDVMIQPNMPRFFRLGDKGQIAARLFNTSENEVKGNARLELIDPETEKVVYTTSKPFTIGAGKSTGITFDVDATVEKYANLPLLICRVIASGDGFSDGEQHYLPILPNYEQVINTVPFTQHGPGTKTIDLSKLFGKGTALSGSLTVEYTNTPAWMMIQTLPSVAKPHDKDALSQAAAFYSNSIANYLLKELPNIKTTIDQWKMEEGNETSLMSSLEKNQELKTLVLEETPWVADAHHESEQKMLLSDYFDENAVSYRLNENLTQLRKLQNGDGSWSWWPKMRGSFYMTVAISKMFVRLNTMIGTQRATEKMLDNAYSFMGREILEEVKIMKEMEKKGYKNVRPSETAIDWLYLTTLDSRDLSKKVAAAKEYLVNHLAMQTREFTIYGKAVSAVILAKNGYEKKAKEYLQSIREYSVYKEEMGRYFDTRKAYYNWFDYKIPTEVSAIEAISLLQPEDSITVEEMQRWLLQSKRTQSWDTPINAVNAVYAFLNNNLSVLDRPVSLTALKVDNREIDTSKATAGLGYVKDTQEGMEFKTFTAEKTSKGTSWGAVYAISLQPVTDIDDASSGLKVTREVLVDNKRLEKEGGKLKVGDRIKIRITIEAERDYDFVQVSDKRAACLEPIGQLSGYHWGYYCAPRDNVTNYYFDRMAKGRHIVETEYYIDRTGTYQTGTCTVQCAYSPEYIARTAAQTFTITE